MFDGIFCFGFDTWKNIITQPWPLSPVPRCLKRKKDILICSVEISLKQKAGDPQKYAKPNLGKCLCKSYKYLSTLYASWELGQLIITDAAKTTLGFTGSVAFLCEKKLICSFTRGCKALNVWGPHGPPTPPAAGFWLGNGPKKAIYWGSVAFPCPSLVLLMVWGHMLWKPYSYPVLGSGLHAFCIEISPVKDCEIGGLNQKQKKIQAGLIC